MQPKLIPFFDSIPGKSVSSVPHQSTAATFRRLFPPGTTANKVLWCGQCRRYERRIQSYGRHIVRFACTEFVCLLSMLVSPKEVVLGSEVHQQICCHLLCGLRQWGSVDGIRLVTACFLLQHMGLGMFHFLPFDLNELCVTLQETEELSGVEVGKMYEVVVTTYRGLFRYRLGDIVKIVGFHISSPEVEFVMKAPKSSNEVITERDLLTSTEGFQLAKRFSAAKDFCRSQGKDEKL